MKWGSLIFGDLYSEKTRNGVYKSAEYHGHGIKIVNMGELFANGFIGSQSMERVELSEKEMQTSLLLENDLLFARRSLVESGAGKASIVRGLCEMTTFESSVIRVRLNTDICVPMFYYYWFKSHRGREAIQPLVTGVNVKGIRGSELLDMKVDYPPLQTQNRIASFLYAYDSLIEKNLLQIKLLEEAAQRLYKEWFIDLRFPGHETTPIHDGIPEGWEMKTVGDLCALMKKTIAPEAMAQSTPYIGLEHIPRKDFCLSQWSTASEVTSNKYQFNKGDIIFGQIRPYFHKVGFAIVDGVASTDSFVMRANENTWGLFLMTVSSEAFVNYSYQTCKEGAKMPRADWNQMKKYEVLIASAPVQQQFETIIKDITNNIRAKALQCRFLSEARDRLLPKLMSGEIEV